MLLPGLYTYPATRCNFMYPVLDTYPATGWMLETVYHVLDTYPATGCYFTDPVLDVRGQDDILPLDAIS